MHQEEGLIGISLVPNGHPRRQDIGLRGRTKD